MRSRVAKSLVLSRWFQKTTTQFYSKPTDLLGYLVEVVSGQTLASFIAENITVPLNMADTHFYLPANKAGRLATLYAHVDGKGLVGVFMSQVRPVDSDVKDKFHTLVYQALK